MWLCVYVCVSPLREGCFGNARCYFTFFSHFVPLTASASAQSLLPLPQSPMTTL